MSLIETLTSQLGVSSEQAEGGAGLLLQMAKEKLASGDFSQLNDLIPDDVEALMSKAPAAEAEGSTGGGIMGSLGSVAGALGMGDIADKLGDLGALAGGFDKLGLDTGMVSKFASALLDFLKSKGGDQIVTILQSILK